MRKAELSTIGTLLIGSLLLLCFGYMYSREKFIWGLKGTADYFVQNEFKKLHEPGYVIPPEIRFKYSGDRTTLYDIDIKIKSENNKYFVKFGDDVPYIGGDTFYYKYNFAVGRWECFDDGFIFGGSPKSCHP